MLSDYVRYLYRGVTALQESCYTLLVVSAMTNTTNFKQNKLWYVCYLQAMVLAWLQLQVKQRVKGFGNYKTESVFQNMTSLSKLATIISSELVNFEMPVSLKPGFSIGKEKHQVIIALSNANDRYALHALKEASVYL